MADAHRIEELRRRVQKDPASIACAQLAEEYRRSGDHEEAVAVCLAGLAIHPGYVSARVTLGRALIQLGRLDDAKTELQQVLATAPENLSAIRGLAQIHQRCGSIVDALAQYRAALSLAPNDPELEHMVSTLAGQIQTPEAAVASAASTSDEGRVEREARTVAALEKWLEAIHVARANRRA